MTNLKLTKKYSTYPEYTDSGTEWLGKIPKDWRLEKLKNSFNFEKGKNAALFTQDYIGHEKNLGEYPVYSGQTENNGIMGRIRTYEYDLQNPAIFTTTVGAKAMTPLVLNGKFSLSQNCLLMVPRNENVYSQFFYYQLFGLFKSMKDEIPSHMQPSLRVTDLNKSRVICIGVGEQKHIADYLDQKMVLIDQTIEKKLRQIELLREKRTAVINHAVTKGLDPNVELVESGIEWIGKIPKGWGIRRIKDVSSYCSRGGSPEYTEDENGYKYINQSCIRDGSLDLEKIKYSLSLSKKGLIKKGDILVNSTGTGTLGRLSVFEDDHEYFADTHVTILRPSTIDSVFLMYLIQNPAWQDYLYASSVTGSTNQIELSRNKFLEIPIIFPRKGEQEEISKYLSKKTKLIALAIQKIEKSIKLLKEFKSSLISHVVTGKIKI